MLENRRFLSELSTPRLRGRREGGDLLLHLEWASLCRRSSPCSPFPPRAIAARPLVPSFHSLGPGGERKGRRGTGEVGAWTRVRKQLQPDPYIPAPRVLPGPASGAAAAPEEKGLDQGRRGLHRGCWTGHHGTKSWGQGPP